MIGNIFHVFCAHDRKPSSSVFQYVTQPIFDYGKSCVSCTCDRQRLLSVSAMVSRVRMAPSVPGPGTSTQSATQGSSSLGSAVQNRTSDTPPHALT